MRLFLTTLGLLLCSTSDLLASATGAIQQNFTTSGYGLAAIAIFAGAYLLVILEEQLHLRKSKPVIVAAGLIWIIVALAYNRAGLPEVAHDAIRHNLLEFAELFLFLLAAMTYINAMSERSIFRSLRSWLVTRGFSLRSIFWLTGLLAFLISPIADNLTTALLMGAAIVAVGNGNQRFISISCINIVIAANAGGAFSPFGDITTLMVWQKGKLEFFQFFSIFIPALVNWLLPALIMSRFISKELPDSLQEREQMKLGAKRIILLFLLTIVTAVSFHNFLHLPPAVGMMLGMGYLSFFAFWLKKKENRVLGTDNPLDMTSGNQPVFDLFRKIARAEWDTLLFFYGIILCVGGLGQLGYLAVVSKLMYLDLGATSANVLVGLLSAIVDNIPVMFAVLTMNPEMSSSQWLLVTLTAGCGGSLLSIGSAAGVALMGQARGVYTFNRHLVWLPVIALGYAASILAHLLLNGR
ncbi:MAG: sodium:proton antiporter NhaD [Desulfuromonadales bacterium]|nr:sodium:proton antiporter NhaD [Desulfuromonadales bacterium]